MTVASIRTAPVPAQPTTPRPVAARPASLPPTAPQQPGPLPVSPLPRYRLAFATDSADVAAAQRLRHRVFAEEMGAVLDTPVPGLDVDPLDDYCDHLLIREQESGTVVGTYRLLRPAQARRAGRLYSDSEFDLTRIADLRGDLVEVGRSCIHPDHRGDGSVINLMWGGIARYLTEGGNTWIAGCCSVPLADGGATAAGVWNTVAARHLAPEEYRVTPHRPWDPTGVTAPDRTPVPPLLRGYLRLGAWVAGPPAYDADFGVADLFVLLSLQRTDPRYLRHFLSGVGA
ncbi:GNAT family N-acetyltransferase [Kitasatospora nipponensis]|uniref:GNAT family N-acetyltransferase n=1 Tax=Kitasatospora nipponensis TaxID=258049 RepID=A0ABP4DQF3_9ACTN